MTKNQKLHHQTISRKCKTCLWFSLGLVITLTLIKMSFSNRSATWGHNLENLKQQTSQVKKQNLYLKTKLLTANGGLLKLKQQALASGYVEKPIIKYIGTTPTVAQKLP